MRGALENAKNTCVRSVPQSLREGAFGLGASKFQVSLRVVFPAALSGIVAALVLGASRAVGETVLVLVAGGQTPNLGLNPTESFQTMAAYIAAQARVATAQADLTTAELRVQYGTVRAPDSGTVTSRTVSVGQIVQAGAEMLRLLRQDRVEWRAEVPESQLSRVKVGQSVQVSAVDGTVLQGRVRAVAPTVQTSNRTGLVYVDITGGNARPGMFARGEIAAGSGTGILVPISSVAMPLSPGSTYDFGAGGW